MVESPLDRIVLTDPAVRYRPERVRGTRYIVKADDAPEPPERGEDK
jgi:hypothetical protein